MWSVMKTFRMRATCRCVAPIEKSMPADLLLMKRPHRIDQGRAPGREVCGDERDDADETNDASESEGIDGRDIEQHSAHDA